MKSPLKALIPLLLFVSLPAAAQIASTLVGTVHAIEGDVIVLAAGAIRVDASEASFLDNLSTADLHPGDRVHLFLSPGNPPRAYRVILVHSPEVEINGAIDAIAASSITVQGITVDIDDDSQFFRPGILNAGLNDFRPGDTVYVAAHSENGRVVLDRLAIVRIPTTLPPPVTRPGEVMLEGNLTAKNGMTWIVAGTRVAVTPRTEVKGDPQIGDRVRVVGIRGNNELLALSVTKL